LIKIGFSEEEFNMVLATLDACNWGYTAIKLRDRLKHRRDNPPPEWAPTLDYSKEELETLQREIKIKDDAHRAEVKERKKNK
jgi:hypothetical protein